MSDQERVALVRKGTSAATLLRAFERKFKLLVSYRMMRGQGNAFDPAGTAGFEAETRGAAPEAVFELRAAATAEADGNGQPRAVPHSSGYMSLHM